MNDKTKILIVINNLGVGGAERLVIDDINEMLARGLDVTLITLKLEKTNKTLYSQLDLGKDRWINIDFGSLLNLKSWFVFAHKLKALKPDVLITHLWYSNTIGRILGKICGVKNIITFEHNVYDTLKTWKMFFLDRLFQGFSTHIVAVSGAVKNSLIRHGIKIEKIKVILNGIDISKYKDKEIKKNDKFTFIFIGRLIHQKGVDILLQAFAKTKEGQLLIVGTGAEEENLKSLSRELKVVDRVKFLGTRQDIPELLLSSDCFVLPSRYEGLPMVLLEAIAARKIIIVSDFESASELIQNNINGIMVHKENIGELAIAMNRVVEDPNLRSNLQQGVSKISESVSIEKHVDGILNI